MESKRCVWSSSLQFLKGNGINIILSSIPSSITWQLTTHYKENKNKTQRASTIIWILMWEKHTIEKLLFPN